jgi:hypothetical protein
MSEKTTTPVPVSSCRTSSRAAGSSAAGSSAAATGQHLELRGPAAEDMRDRARKALAQAVMRNDQDADHRGISW